MYEVRYRTDSDDRLKELVISVNTELSDDIVVARIHNDQGEFVAEDIEGQIDFGMNELRDTDMYVKYPWKDELTVYTEDEVSSRQAFSESVQNSSRKLDGNYGSTGDWFENLAIDFGLLVLPPVVIYLITQYLVPLFGVGFYTLSPIFAVAVLFSSISLPHLKHYLWAGITASISAATDRGRQINKLFKLMN